MGYKFQFRRGLEADLPELDNGEPAITEDTAKMFVGTPTGNRQLTFDQDKYDEYDNQLESVKSQLADTAKKIVGVITPEMFGAKGDGVLLDGNINPNPTDDTTAIQACFNALKDERIGKIDLQGKTYMVSASLQLPSMWDKTIENGRIKAMTTFVGEYVIECQDGTVFREQSNNHDLEDMTFTKFTVDGSLVTSCFHMLGHIRTVFDNCNFNRYKKYGLYIHHSGHETYVTNSYFRYAFADDVNDKTVNGGIGIYTTQHDDFFNNLIIVGGYAGILVEGRYNFFDHIHVYSTEYFAIVKNSQNTFSHCYVDGCKFRVENPWAFSLTDSRFLNGWQLADRYPDTTEYAFMEFVNTKGTGIVLEGVVLSNLQIELFNQTASTVTAKFIKFEGTFLGDQYKSCMISNIQATNNVQINIKTNYFSDTINAEQINISSQNPYNNSNNVSPRKDYAELHFSINPFTGLPYGASSRTDGGKIIFDTRYNYSNQYPIGMKIQLSDSKGTTPLAPEDKFYFHKGGHFQPLGGYKAVDGSNGVSGSFTTTDGKTITIKNGIVTSIV
jgi:hypothetical protein